MKDNKRKKTIALILVAVVLVSITVSFAYFTSGISNDRAQTAVLKTGTMALTFDDNDNGINKKLTFGESVTKKFKIINTGTLEASLSLDFDQMINTYMNGSLSYNLSYSLSEDGEYEEIIPETNMPVSSEPLTQTLAQELSVPAGDTYYYNLTITLNNTEFDQTDDKDAVYNTRFDVGNPIKYRYYSLTVDPNGGTLGEYTSPQEYLLQNKDTLEIKDTPTKIGSNFLGWKLVGVSSTYNDNTFTMGISDSKLIAQWDNIKYNLTVNLDGGSYDGELPTEVEYGSTIELKTPTKDGYDFSGWSTEVGSMEGNNFTMTGTSDVLITANWTVKNYEYKIIHRQMNVDGSGYTEVDTETGFQAYGTTLNATVKTYEGFTSPSAKVITIGTTDNTVTYDYTRNRYNVTIETQGGSYSGEKSVTMYYGATTDIPNPSRSGYTFSGWEVSKGTLAGTTYTCGAGNATLTATWVPNTYKYLVYHDQMNLDGSTYMTADTTPGEGAYGSTVSPNTKTYTGFTSPAKRSLTIGVENNNPPTSNILTYQYARNQYTLAIDVNGGTYSGTNPGKMYYGASITLGTPTKKNYTFNGWTKTAGEDSTLSGSTFTMGSSNSTVRAGWTVKTCSYTVKHLQENANDSNYTTVSTEDLTADCGTTQTPTVNTYTGFGKPSAESVTLEEGVTPVVEYKYNRNTYTLTINPNGGAYNSTLSNSTQTLKYGQTYTLLTPTRTGYSYTWSKTSGTDATLSGSTFTMGTGDAVVTANWSIESYSILLNANGGKFGTSTTKSKTVYYNGTYGTLDTPTYEGYKFLGWFTSKNGGTQITSSTKYTRTTGQTLYAHWKEDNIIPEMVTAIINKQTVPYVKSGSPTFADAATTNETTDELYSLADDYGTSYYYRGAVENNYVKFGGFYWRVIRINGDGSVRMIYDGTQAWPNGNGASTFTTSGTDRFTHTNVAWNSNWNLDAKYVGWMYGGANGEYSTSKDQAQTNETNSNIKTEVDTWYKTNIADKNLSKYVSDEIFCNDRSTPGSASTGWSEDSGLGYGNVDSTGYGATARTGRYTDASKVQPKFTCGQKNDAFTVKNSTKGNGVLTYPVGLITADEILAAGSGKYNTSNRYYYLYKASNYNYWSLSPSIKPGYQPAYVYNISDSAYLGYREVTKVSAVAPVINIAPEYAATMTGLGTMDSPYKIPGVE